MNDECMHFWVANSGKGGDPVFKENRQLSEISTMHVKCEKCGARTWISEDDWDKPVSNVTAIQDHFPHLTIPAKKAVHVLPVSLIRDVIDGRKLILEIEGWEDFLPVILDDYLKGLEGD